MWYVGTVYWTLSRIQNKALLWNWAVQKKKNIEFEAWFGIFGCAWQKSACSIFQVQSKCFFCRHRPPSIYISQICSLVVVPCAWDQKLEQLSWNYVWNITSQWSDPLTPQLVSLILRQSMSFHVVPQWHTVLRGAKLANHHALYRSFVPKDKNHMCIYKYIYIYINIYYIIYHFRLNRIVTNKCYRLIFLTFNLCLIFWTLIFLLHHVVQVKWGIFDEATWMSCSQLCGWET